MLQRMVDGMRLYGIGFATQVDRPRTLEESIPVLAATGEERSRGYCISFEQIFATEIIRDVTKNGGRHASL